MASIKLRAKADGDVTTIKCLMTHPRETGQGNDKNTGKLIPAHYIETVTAEHGGKQVIEAQLSGGISKNPYLSFKFKGGKAGDTVKVAWTDNTGKSDSAEAAIK